MLLSFYKTYLYIKNIYNIYVYILYVAIVDIYMYVYV